MGKIPDTRTLRSTPQTSKDKLRVAQYRRIPEGWAGRPTAYRLIRTERARRGFGMIIHTITTFCRSKAEAAKIAAFWVGRRG